MSVSPPKKTTNVSFVPQPSFSGPSLFDGPDESVSPPRASSSSSGSSSSASSSPASSSPGFLIQYFEDIAKEIAKSALPEPFKTRLVEGFKEIKTPDAMVSKLEEAFEPKLTCFIHDQKTLKDVFAAIENCKEKGSSNSGAASTSSGFTVHYEGDLKSACTWVRNPDSKDPSGATPRTFIVLPEGEETLVLGDLHGDLDSAILWLQNHGFDARGELRRIIGLGDMVDRGKYGIGTLMFFALLRTLYPDKAFLLAGNHEDYLAESLLKYMSSGLSQSFAGFHQLGISQWDIDVIDGMRQNGYLRRFAVALQQLPLTGFLKDGTMLVHGNPAWPYDKVFLGNLVTRSVGMFVFSQAFSGGYHALWSDQALGSKIVGSKSRGPVKGPGFNNGSEVYVEAKSCGIVRILHGHCHKFYNQQITFVNGGQYFITSLISSAANNLKQDDNCSYCGLVGKGGRLTVHKYSPELKVFEVVKGVQIIGVSSVVTNSVHSEPQIFSPALPLANCLLPSVTTTSSSSMFSCPTSSSKPITHSKGSVNLMMVPVENTDFASHPLAELPSSLLKHFLPPSTTLTQSPK